MPPPTAPDSLLPTRVLLRPLPAFAAIALAAVAIHPTGHTPSAGRRHVRAAPPVLPSATRPTSTPSSTPNTTTTTVAPSPEFPGAPADIAALAPGPLAGEGHWYPAGRAVGGRVVIWVTAIRPPGALPATDPVGVARIDVTALRVVLYAGTTQPAGTWADQGDIAPALRPSLAAVFNGGFQFGTAPGGFFADGHADPPLVPGAASLVVYDDGSAAVGEWGRDMSLTPDVAQVRQNLHLLVDGGAVVPSAAQPELWGSTLHGAVSTWRSAVGSDAAHHLFFVGGPGLTPAGLGAVLVAAGAREGMELDINPQWVLFVSFGAGGVGSKLLPSMGYPVDHYFVPGWRDFVAVFTRP